MLSILLRICAPFYVSKISRLKFKIFVKIFAGLIQKLYL